MQRWSKYYCGPFALALIYVISACAPTDVPGRRTINIPEAAEPSERFQSVNQQQQSIVYVELDEDVLRPKVANNGDFPDEEIGPFELRSETLAAALQFVLADYNIPLAFETDEALTRTITISGLRGSVDKVVARMCSLADLYCSYEDDILTIKETETFTVALPPIAQETYDDFINGLAAVIGTTPIVDNTTRSIIYTASHRTNRRATDYFDRLRSNTALIVFETQIWEVNLNDQHDTGIDWSAFNVNAGDVALNFTRDGTPTIAGAFGVGAAYTSGDLSFDGVFNFLSTQGAVKTVSQPQITVLSGSEATMRIGNSRQYISEVTSNEGFSDSDNLSVETSTLETGLTINIQSAWDNSTVYGNLTIELQDLINLDTVDVGNTSIQLPETSERVIETRIRIRPGDALLIGGIVQERDDYDNEGPGVANPLFSTRRSTGAANSELVYMMRPRVIIYTDHVPDNAEVLANDYLIKTNIGTPPSTGAYTRSKKIRPAPLTDDEVEKLDNMLIDQTESAPETQSLLDYLSDLTSDAAPRDITRKPMNQ